MRQPPVMADDAQDAWRASRQLAEVADMYAHLLDVYGRRGHAATLSPLMRRALASRLEELHGALCGTIGALDDGPPVVPS